MADDNFPASTAHSLAVLDAATADAKQAGPRGHRAQSRNTPPPAIAPRPPENPGVPFVKSTSASPIKRAHEPDVTDEVAKRIKVEHEWQETEQDGRYMEPELMDLNIEALLKSALQQVAEPVPTVESAEEASMDDSDTPTATVTPVPEKQELMLMKVSSHSIYMMRSMSLPVLGNIAVQVLLRLSQLSRAETEKLLANAESDFRKSYDTLVQVFALTRKVFCDSSLLHPDGLDITDSEDRETVRISNLAAASSSIFVSGEVPLGDIHDKFLAIFVPEDGELMSTAADLFVAIKTQAFIGTLTDGQEDICVATELLNKYFADDFPDRLKQRSGDTELTTEEEKLAEDVMERKGLLAGLLTGSWSKKSIQEHHPLISIKDSLSSFLQDHLSLIAEYAEKYGVNIPVEMESAVDESPATNEDQDFHDRLPVLLQSVPAEANIDSIRGLNEVDRGEPLYGMAPGGLNIGKLLEQSLAGQTSENKAAVLEQEDPSGFVDSQDLASFLAEKLDEISPEGLQNAKSSYQHADHMARIGQPRSSSYRANGQGTLHPRPVGTDGALPPNQSSPTTVLYDKARYAAAAKSSTNNRRDTLHSTRRPWTDDEERALMTGLDMVKGPHWSQILSLFGPNGSVSAILKDRSQVQLKDKARNLKLFFLKTNTEMPYYLQSVTGELKTRAPSSAARKEAAEKARRLTTVDERSRVHGLNLQNKLGEASDPAPVLPSSRTNPTTLASSGLATPIQEPARIAPAPAPALTQVPPPAPVKIEPLDSSGLPQATLPLIAPARAPGVTHSLQATSMSSRPLLPQHVPHQQICFQQLHRQQDQQQRQQPQQRLQPQDVSRDQQSLLLKLSGPPDHHAQHHAHARPSSPLRTQVPPQHQPQNGAREQQQSQTQNQTQTTLNSHTSSQHESITSLVSVSGNGRGFVKPRLPTNDHPSTAPENIENGTLFDTLRAAVVANNAAAPVAEASVG